jgi:DNA-directed RNA polymerase subunit RPC12/RpoP
MEESRQTPARYYCHQCGKEATYVPKPPRITFGGKTTPPPRPAPTSRIAECPHCGATNELPLR